MCRLAARRFWTLGAVAAMTGLLGLMTPPAWAACEAWEVMAEQDPPEPQWEAFAAEFTTATKRAGEILQWVDQERARIRNEHIARMTRRQMYREGFYRVWSPELLEKNFDLGTEDLRERQQRLERIAADWDQIWYAPAYAAPSIFDGMGNFRAEDPDAPPPPPPPPPPRERINSAGLEMRLQEVRAELDEIVIRAVTAIWHDRLQLTGLDRYIEYSDSSFGEASAIAAEAQVKLDRLAQQWQSNEKYQSNQAKREARRAEIEAQEKTITDDPSLAARIEASIADLEPLRVECARRLIGWGGAAQEMYAAGPQEPRQAHLDSLQRYINGIFERDFTLLIRSDWWMNHDETEPQFKTPVTVHLRRVQSWDKGLPVTLYTRPDFAPNLRELAALDAAPARPIGHREVMPPALQGKPHVFAAVVVRDSLSVDPIDRLLEPDAPPKPPPSEPGVTLLVLGVNLLGDGESQRGPLPLESDSPMIDYQEISAAPGIARIKPDYELTGLFREGLQQATSGLTLRDAWPMHLMDAMLFNVRLKPGLTPGYRTFKIGAAETIWPLKSASTTGFISFVRERPSRLADEVDHPDEFFVFDRFCVEVQTEHELEVDELRLVVVHNDGPLQLSKSVDESGDGVLIARKVPGFATRLRTRPVFIEQRGGATPQHLIEPNVHYAQMERGDALLATTEGLLFAAPVVDFANIYLTPGDLKPVASKPPQPGQPQPANTGGSLLFTEAVAEACRINDVHLPNLNLADELVVDTITHTVVFNWQRHKINFSLLDHAAMLLMKRTFIQIADQRLKSLETLYASDDLIRGHIPVMAAQFRAWNKQFHDSELEVRRDGFPMLKKTLRVHMIDGQTAYGKMTPYGREQWHPSGYALWWAFNDQAGHPTKSPWWNEHFEDHNAFARFRFDVTKEALRLQIEETKRAIEHAQDADDDDVEELLELTGRGFEPVVARIVPRLVYLDSDPATQKRRWLPHERARAAIVRLGNTLAEHETAGKAAKEDTEAILAVVSSIGLGAGANIVGKTILAIGSGLGIGAATKDLVQLHEDKAEVRFAADALEIIGRDRLELGLAQRQISAMPYISMALSVVGFRLDLADAAAVVRTWEARKVAERWMPHIAREGMSALAQVPVKDRSLVYMMMKEAEEAAAAGRTLTSGQQAAIDAQKRIDLEFAAPHPYGWPHVDDYAFRKANTEVDIKSSSPDADTSADASGVVPDAAAPIPTPAPRPVMDAPLGAAAPAPPSALAAADDAAEAALERTRKYMPIEEIPPGMPRPGYVVEVPAAAAEGAAIGAAKKYLVGQPLGKGAYATTYELLDEFGAPTGDVIKFLRTPFRESKQWLTDRIELLKEIRNGDTKYLQRLLGTQPAFDQTPLPEVIDRMLAGQRLLDDAHIPCLEMKPLDDALGQAGRNEDLPFVVQRQIPSDGSFVLCKIEQSGLPHAGMAEAVAELYRKIADAGLVWKDGHLENIFFQKVGDKWVAGVLDPDMIVKWDDPIGNKFVRLEIDETFKNCGAPPRIKSLDRFEGEDPLNALELDATPEAIAALNASYDVSQHIQRDVAGSSQEFMAKMLEYWDWVAYNPYRRARAEAEGKIGEFIDGRIDMTTVREKFPEIDQWVRRQPSQF